MEPQDWYTESVTLAHTLERDPNLEELKDYIDGLPLKRGKIF